MMTEGDERAHYAGSGAGVKLRKRPFRPGGNYAATIGISELEQILKQKTFTRSELQHLIALLHSRIKEELASDNITVERDVSKPPTLPVLSPEASSTSGSLKKCKHRDDSDNFHAAVFCSRQIASPAEVTNAYKGSTNGTGQAPTQDSEPLNIKATALSKISLKHPTTMENLPDELLSNIFIRLLAKQLSQMRSVSKSWNAFLSQPSFIKSHLHHSIHNNNQILLDFNGVTSTYTSTPFRIHTCRSSNLELTNFIKVTVSSQFEYCDVIRVIGSINGLLCYSYNDSVIHILNPSLSASVTLPPNCMPSDGYKSIKVYFRFVFDPKADDYKVVKLTGLTGPRTCAVKWWLQTEIYSMRKGLWELITERFPSHITSIADGDYICSDGHDGRLHWLCCINKKRGSQRIVAFDLGLQTFREIQLPDSTLDHNCSNVLGVLSRMLCVMSKDEDEVIEVWVMEEYGVAESWVKRHVFSQFYYIGIYGFTSQNQFLIVSKNSRLVLYDPVSNKETLLEDCCFGSGGSDKIVEYVDSLVWVAPNKREMVDDARQNLT